MLQDYFKLVFEMESFEIVRHVVLYLLSLILAITAYLFIIGAFFQRSKIIMNATSSSLIDFVPGILKTFGVISAIFPLLVRLLGFFSALLAATPFFPLDGLTVFFLKIPLLDVPSIITGYGINSFEEYIKQLIAMGVPIVVMGFITAFVNLTIMYLLSALYNLVVDYLRR